MSYDNLAVDLLLAELPTAPGVIITNDPTLPLDSAYQVLDFSVLQNTEHMPIDSNAIVLYKPAFNIDPLKFFSQVLEALISNGVLLIVHTFATRFSTVGCSQFSLLRDFLALADRFNFNLERNHVLAVDEQNQQTSVLLKFTKGTDPKWRLSYLDKSDTKRMLGLFEKTFHHVMSLEFRQWKYAHPDALTVCVWEDDNLIGSLGGMPRKVLFFGQPQTVIQIGDVMVDVRKRGILTKTGPFFRMTATFLERCAGFGKPFLCIFGFPNERHMRLAEHLNFYKEVGRIFEFSWPALLKNPSFFTSLIEVNANNINSLSLKIDRLWLAMAADLQNNVVGIRDTQYILNRYLQHPENEYKIFLMQHKLTRKVTGLMVLHAQNGRCSLIDLIAPLAAIPALLLQARYLSNTLHCERLFGQISNTFADYFKTKAYQQEAVSIPIAKDTWVAGPDYKELVDTWWLMSGDMDFR
jgi:hypothetical protein